jgi:phosphomevalonate kinase
VLGREVGPDAAAAIARIRVDTGALQQGGVKLGLGSSAAATVAAIGAALHVTGGFDPARVAALAAMAHAEAQARRGAAGSGADVAACARGGAIAFTQRMVRALPVPAGLQLDFAWTHSAADTAALVAAVTAVQDQPACAAAFTAIAAAAAVLTGALAADDARNAVRAIAAAATAVQTLADATGVALVPPVVAALQARLPAGAIAKTTGAGGGDIVVVASTAAVDRKLVAAAIVEAGLSPLALALDPTGVDITRAGA